MQGVLAAEMVTVHSGFESLVYNVGARIGSLVRDENVVVAYSDGSVGHIITGRSSAQEEMPSSPPPRVRFEESVLCEISGDPALGPSLVSLK